MRRVAALRSAILGLLVLLAIVVACVACRKKAPTALPDEPPIAVRDTSEGLLLTWIDDKGEFHTELKVTDVPMMGRDAVRVIDPNRDEGTHEDKVFVADLRQAKPDGTYPISAMPLHDFDAIAVARREKNGPTLASAASAAASAVASALAQGRDPDVQPPTIPGRPSVIIYGAEWCGACHQAAAYLKRKGIAYVEKDIEKDPQAAREMQSKLRGAGIRTGSIPVLDVRGRVMVGFNPQQVDEALGHAT